MRSTEHFDINLSYHNSLLKNELSGSWSVACCRWMFFTSPFFGPFIQTAVFELRPFSALNSTKIPPFFPPSPSHYRASWGPSSVQLLVLEFLRLPPHDPLSCHHPSLNSSVFGTLLAKSMSINQCYSWGVLLRQVQLPGCWFVLTSSSWHFS